MNKYLNIFLKVSGYIAFLLLLTFFGQFLFRYLYYVINNMEGSWIGSNKSWSLVFGEIFSYFFFSLFLIVIFCNKYVKIFLLSIVFILNLLLVMVTFGTHDALFIVLFILPSLSGYLLAELIKFSYKKLKK